MHATTDHTAYTRNKTVCVAHIRTDMQVADLRTKKLSNTNMMVRERTYLVYESINNLTCTVK